VNATVKSGSKRHDIVMHARREGDTAHWDEIAQRVVPPWLSAKLADIGVDAAAGKMAVEAYSKRRFLNNPMKRGENVTVAATDVRGIGTVRDPDLLRAGLLAGVGSGRIYGCGMLLLKRVAAA
jgi:CRISPR system Cascade subunit CasE